MSAERQREAAKAMAPLIAWARRDEGDVPALRRALRESLEAYMGFFLGRPAFARFILWEDLTGAERLRGARRQATALTDAFDAVRKVAARRGLRRFKVDDAVLMWIALGYAPVAHQPTLKLALDRDVTDAATRRRHIAFAVEQMLFVLAGHEAGQ